MANPANRKLQLLALFVQEMPHLYFVVHPILTIVCVVGELSHMSLVVRAEAAHIDCHVKACLQHLSAARQENHKLLVFIFLNKDWHLE